MQSSLYIAQQADFNCLVRICYILTIPYVVLHVLMNVKNSEPYALKTICFSYLNVEDAPVKLYLYVWGSLDVHLLMQTLLKLFVQHFDCLNLQTMHSFYFFNLLYIFVQSFNIFSHYFTHNLIHAQLLIIIIWPVVRYMKSY